MAPEHLATDLYLGRVIATARQRKGWTQTDLAEAAGLGRTLIIDMETGRASLTVERRAVLTRALGLRADALDAPGFALLTPEEQRLIAEARKNGKSRTRSRILGGRLAPASAEAASC